VHVPFRRHDQLVVRPVTGTHEGGERGGRVEQGEVAVAELGEGGQRGGRTVGISSET
jgi:hypothetical protein